MTQLATAITQTLALKQLPNLAPCDMVNHTLGRLVDCVVHAEAEIFTEDVVREIQYISAEAEGEMERAWAMRIAQSSEPRAEARRFIYWDNYAQLTAHEVALLEQTSLDVGAVRRILVIGSGPLPMTAIHLRQHFPGVTIDHVDKDPTAVAIGRQLLAAIGISSDRYICASGDQVQLTQEYDIVLIAALAGENVVAKQAIIDTVVCRIHRNMDA